MNKKVGFIGSGNMGSAMIGGIVQSGIVDASNIYVADVSEACFQKVNQYSVHTSTNNIDVASVVDILFLAVKPYMVQAVAKEIKDSLKKDVIIVCIAAGKKLEDLQSYFNQETKIVRVMPNTPALVGQAMSALCPNEYVDEAELKEIVSIFESFGKAEIIKENLMDAVTAVSGSSPAYVFMMIEAMADGAVQEGMPRNQAYTFAAQAVYGSALMVLETGKHPGELKDMVCSPAGTTIDAVAKLEQTGFRSSIIEAMKACFEKSKEMSK